MNKQSRESKLSHALLVSAILACIVSALVFMGLQYISRIIIDDYCKKPEVISAQIEKKMNALSQYIKDNRISLVEVSNLKEWMKGKELTEIVVYRNNVLLYSSNTLSPNFSYPTQPQFPDFYLWHNKYTVNFTDGKADVYIKDFFEHRYIDNVTILNILIFFLCFVTIMVVFIRKKVSYIGTLEKEIRILEGGELNYPITIRGSDELASLAQEVDEMRKAFILREEYTQMIKKSTNKLMADISHDLRTPLTALIGYLEVLEGDTLPVASRPFVDKCKNRAIQIKNLTNDLFEYFFISTSDYGAVELASHSVKRILDEILQEHIYLMEQNGFCVSSKIELPDARIQVDIGMIQRVFDNLFSNVQRYANPAYPICLHSILSEHEITLIFQNHIQPAMQQGTNTGLGLANCRKIMLLNQGMFDYEQMQDIFTVKLTFPLV